MKKKILLLVMSAIMVLSLCACGGSDTPTNVADNFLKALKENNTEAIKDFYSGANFDMEEVTKAQEFVGTEMEKIIKEELYPKLQDFEYELSNEKIDGDKATVDVKIKAYNIGKGFQEFFEEYLEEAMPKAFGGATEEEITKLATSIFGDKLKAIKKDYEKTVSLSLTKVDGKWMINELDEAGDFVDAITGGIITATEDLMNQVG